MRISVFTNWATYGHGRRLDIGVSPTAERSSVVAVEHGSDHGVLTLTAEDAAALIEALGSALEELRAEAEAPLRSIPSTGAPDHGEPVDEEEALEAEAFEAIADAVYGVERNEVCVHGHFDCAVFERGPCANEEAARLAGQIIRARVAWEASDEYPEGS